MPFFFETLGFLRPRPPRAGLAMWRTLGRTLGSQLSLRSGGRWGSRPAIVRQLWGKGAVNAYARSGERQGSWAEMATDNRAHQHTNARIEFICHWPRRIHNVDQSLRENAQPVRALICHNLRPDSIGCAKCPATSPQSVCSQMEGPTCMLPQVLTPSMPLAPKT